MTDATKSAGEESHTGGCQCGAVRFRISGVLGRASICHCRMCQKAFGGFYAPLVAIDKAQIAWTRGEPAHFRSSNHITRGFCPACGTPLTYEEPGNTMAVAIGAFDAPGGIVPTIQYGVEGKIASVDHLAGLPSLKTIEDLENAGFLADIRSNQHPDEDTGDWPPADWPQDAWSHPPGPARRD